MGTLVVNLTQPRVHLRKEPSITALPVLRVEQLSVSCTVTSCDDGIPAWDLWLKTEPFFPKPHLSGYFITSTKMKTGQHWTSPLEHSVLEHGACSIVVAKYMFTNLGKQEEFD